MTKEDIRLIRDEVGGIVPQYFNEDNQEYAVETTDGSYVTRADFNFGKTKLLRDRKGGILPQLWNPELQAFEVRTAQNGGGSGTGTQGPRGYSAYQVAIQDGFEGTQEEWLVSLKGEDGIDGKNGADGKSAYEIAVEKGFIGTESDWLASLEGETGAPGTTTWAGITDKPTEFKPEAHTHEMTDVNGLETAISTEVSKIVDSAPETLNTLNELAAALGDDPNFATTVATEIGKKADADHKHVIADVTNLQTELDEKAKQTDLNTTNSNVTDLQENVSTLSQTVTQNHNVVTEHLAQIASETELGHVKVDGTTILIDEYGVISSVGGGGGGGFEVPNVSGFMGSSATNGKSINLSWVNPTNAEFKRVEMYVSTTNISNLKLEEIRNVATKVVDGTNESYSHPSTAGEQYYFKIFAVHEIIGERYSSGSSVSVVATDTVPPGNVTNIQVIPDNEKFTVTWVNPLDVDLSKVKVLMKTGDYPTSAADGTVIYEGTGTSVTVDNLTNNQVYYLRFFVSDTTGNVNDSTDMQTTATPVDIGTVTGVGITQNAPGTLFTLNWTNPTDATYVKTEVYASTSDLSAKTRAQCIADATLIYNGTNPTTSHVTSPGQTYYFKLFTEHLVGGATRYDVGVSISKQAVDTAPPNPITNFTASSGDGSAILNWVNPTDADFLKVVIRYKVDSYPTSPTDGQSAYDGSGTTTNVTGLTNGETCYFRAFTFDTSGNVNDVASQQVTVQPSSQKIYGIEIDESNSNPSTRVTYTDDAVGMTPMAVSNYGSWENVIKEEFGINSVLLKNKVVQYYLNNENRTLKKDGSPAVLTGADGDVMTEFAKPLYLKWTTVGTVHKIQVSNKPFTGAVSHAFEMENGYNLVPYYPLMLMQALFTLFYKSTDSQTALGRGFVDGNPASIASGGTNTKGMNYGEVTGKLQMAFLGVEDFWGNKLWWIDGLVTDGNFNILIGKSGFNDAGSGYTSYPSGTSANLSGYVDKVQGGNEKGFIIKASGGSETTHYADYGNLNSSRVAAFGGLYSHGSYAGAFYLRLAYAASDAHAYIGARLFCAADGKFYVGAYLGTTVSGKLRSISGQTVSDTKTIGTFRAEAKANN